MVTLFLFENKACGIVLNALKSVDRGFIYTKEKGIAVVNARHDEQRMSLAVASVDRCFLIRLMRRR